MLVLLVRHGHAGSKRQWRRDDSLRPLDVPGFAEAMSLRQTLIPFQPARIISSPYLRCIQSVTPLAEALGIGIEPSPSLTPEAGAAATSLVRALAGEGPGAVVLCTHGEVIHDLQARLQADGDAPPAFGVGSPREKGSVWVLDGEDGRLARARYIAPPHGA